jgi:hypothetical protein
MSQNLTKAHVKSHIRHEKSGKLTEVKEYDDKRQKKAEAPKSSGIGIINAGVWGNKWRNLGGKIHVYEYQTKPNIELSVFDTSGVKGVQPGAILKELTDYAEKKGKKVELVGMPMALLNKYVGAFHAAGFKPASVGDVKKGVVMTYGKAIDPPASKTNKATKWVVKDTGKPKKTHLKFSGNKRWFGKSGDAFSRSSPMHILKGLALTEPDDRPDDDYDPDALKAGVEVEKEHTKIKSVAKKIAKDHLDEDPDYYKKLKKVDKH